MQEISYPLQAAFLALPLENKAKWEFQRLQELLRDFEDIMSFQNPQSPHLTLQYWPSLMEIEVQQVLRQAAAIAEKAEPFELLIQGVNTFGQRGEDYVLFLTIPFSEPLARLKKLCPWPAGKPFEPHITLARIRHPQRFHIEKKKILKLLSDVSFTTNMSLMRFYGMINNVRQTPLEDFPFR